MQRPRFTYVGLTPAHGKIYEKGKSQLVIYSNGTVRYWRVWGGDDWQKKDFVYTKPQTRDKNGTSKY